MNKILLAHWPIGPTFKDRVKYNLQVFDSYKFFDVLILTDDPEYFDDINYPNVKILDLNYCRDLHPQFNEFEFFPEEKRDCSTYKNQLNNLIMGGKKFSANIQRFSLLYKDIKKYKFISILDCDMVPTHTEEQFKIFENYIENIMPNNSMSTNRAYYTWNNESNLSILEKYSKELNKEIKIEYPIEGCDSLFKFYKFENPEKIEEFFYVWNYILLDAFKTRNHLLSGSWNILPEEILAITYKLLDIKVNSGQDHYINMGGMKSYNFPEDRYWDDWTHNGFNVSVDTKLEFIEKNYDKLKTYYTDQGLKFIY